MSTTLPVRRGADGTALISWPSTFFSMPPLNDRLLFDFPHNVADLFIVSQSDKGRVPQVTIRRPLGKLYLGDQFRL
jgi:hypothetical protein